MRTGKPVRYLSEFVLVIISVWVLFPLFYMIMSAVNKTGTLFMPSLIPDEYSINSFKSLFVEVGSVAPTNFAYWFRNSTIVAFMLIIIIIFVSTLSAYAFSRFKFYGRKSSLLFIVLIQFFPNFLTIVALYRILHALGLLNTMLGLTLIYTGGALPFTTWLITGYFNTIPKELDESASIDGAGYFRTYLQIVIPLAVPILIVVAVINFRKPFNDFLVSSIIMTGAKKYPLVPGLRTLIYNTHDIYNQWGRFSAGAAIAVFPIVLLYVYLQRYLVEGLTKGGIKG